MLSETRDEILEEFNEHRPDDSLSGWFDHGCHSKKPKQKKKRLHKNMKKKTTFVPIFISELNPNVVHLHKQLIGRIVVEPFKMSAIHMVIEDDFKSVARVSIYNDDDNVDRYQNGVKLCINEPYYKLGSNDGKYFIRIDTPSKVELLHHEISIGIHEKTHSEWKELANKCFLNKNYKYASRCYTEGINHYNKTDDTIVTALLNNRSLCYIKTAEYKLAFINIIASKYMDPSVFKTWHREITCLQQLNHHKEAVIVCDNALKVFSDHDHKHKLIALKKKSSKSLSKMKSKKDIQMKYTMDAEWDALGIIVNHITNDAELMNVKQTAIELKQIGNKEFYDGNYKASLKYYTQGLLHCNALSILLSNRSASFIHLKESKKAFQDATVSVIINPNNIKGWVRRSVMSFELHLHTIGDAICKQYEHNNEIFTKYITKFRSDQKDTNKYDDALNAEEKAIQSEQQHSISMTELQAMNQMMALLPPQLESTLINDDIPQFHQLFVKKRRYVNINGCDQRRCNDILLRAYEHGRSLKMHEMHLFSNAETTPQDLMKRLANPDRIKWYFDAKIGEINDFCYAVVNSNGYDTTHFLSFSNTVDNNITVYTDGIHIAIGFCDLGLFTKLNIKSRSNINKAPVKVIAIDMSSYCIAKSYVIYEMLKDEEISPPSILEVWYSATWTKPTAADFSKTLGNILKIHDIKHRIDDDVYEYIKHWHRSQGISIKKARTLWTDSITEVFAEIATFNKLCDILDFAEYVVSGDVTRENKKSVCGNITMFDNTKRCPKKAKNENIYNVLEINHAFIEIWKQTKSLKKSAHVMLLNAIKKLKDLIVNNDIVIEFIHDVLCLDNKVLIERLKGAKPSSVSWSNCIDYIHPMKFHIMAQEIGNKDCVHFAYTMNYQYSTKGSNIIDYALETRKTLFEASKTAIQMSWKNSNAHKIFRFPPIDHPINVGNVSINGTMQKKWIKWFLNKHNPKWIKCNYNEANIIPIIYNPLHRQSCVVGFCWSYVR